MALVVETGTGSATAESYISVADATAYYTLTDTNDTARDALISAWGSADPSAQEAALREATRYLDGKYLERWVGYKKTAAQALAWPRSSGIDAYGYALAADAIPTALKHATAELALRALSVTVAPDQAAGSGSLTSKSFTAGAVSLSQTWSGGGARERARFERVEYLLRPLLGSVGDNVVELRRA